MTFNHLILIRCLVKLNCMLPQASVSTWLFNAPRMVASFSTLRLRMRLSHMAMALALSDPSFPVLLSAFPWKAIGKGCSTPVPKAKPSTL